MHIWVHYDCARLLATQDTKRQLWYCHLPVLNNNEEVYGWGESVNTKCGVRLLFISAAI